MSSTDTAKHTTAPSKAAQVSPALQRDIARVLAERREVYSQIKAQKRKPVQRMHVTGRAEALPASYDKIIKVLCSAAQVLRFLAKFVDTDGNRRWPDDLDEDEDEDLAEVFEECGKMIKVFPAFVWEEFARLTAEFGGLPEFDERLVVEGSGLKRVLASLAVEKSRLRCSDMPFGRI